MSKVKLNIEQLTKLIPIDEKLNEIISNKELIKIVNEKLNKDDILDNSMIMFTEVKEVLYDVYKLVKIYVDVYSDITKIYSLKTCKCKQNVINPYNISIKIFNANHELLYFYVFNEKTRTYRINSIDEVIA